MPLTFTLCETCIFYAEYEDLGGQTFFACLRHAKANKLASWQEGCGEGQEDLDRDNIISLPPSPPSKTA